MFLLPLSAVLLPLYHTSALLSIFGKERRPWRGRRTLEGESPLLKDGALSLQASLTHRELPPCPRRFRSENLVCFLEAAGSWGKFFCVWGGMNLMQRAASHSFCGWEACGFVTLRGWRLIPPHQSLTRQTACSFLPPKGKPFCKTPLHCITKRPNENMKYYLLHIYSLYYSLFKVVFAMYARRKEGFPSGGRKLQAVCRVSD